MRETLGQAIELHRQGDIDGARAAAREALGGRGDDSSTLLFLGLLESRAGQLPDARSWLERAVAAGDRGAALVALARVLARLGAWEALAELDYPPPPGPAGDEYLSLRIHALGTIGARERAANALLSLSSRRPKDAEVAVAAGRALAEAGRLDEAEARYRDVLKERPAHRLALLGLTGLLESLSRAQDLPAVFDAAEVAGADADLVALGAAIRLRVAGQFTQALEALESAVAALPGGTFHQMRGELADRAGKFAEAMASFEAMNRADAADEPQAASGTQMFREMVRAEHAALETLAATAAADDSRPSPVFLLGFPRSGTTLIDTFLMGHPAIQVHEERPYLDRAISTFDPVHRATLTKADVAKARDEYWRALDDNGRDRGKLQVDKYPLASARAPFINQMFPDARYLFALRHPCDVVLSCFMTRFRLNWGVASFLTLEDAAATYGLVMGVWTEARERLGLKVFDVRYEELVRNPVAVIGAAAEFIGAGIDQSLANHRDAAATRGMIPTPSHAQVIQPVYSRAVDRWVRYRSWLEPILPTLQPWCEKFGYEV